MLKKTFCSSPWFHIRINPAGYFIPCRWAPEWLPEHHTSNYNISSCSIADYMNSEVMRNFRLEQLSATPGSYCTQCYQEDSYGKLSGRHRQLLKSAITVDNFDKTLCASPHFALFDYTHKNHGITTKMPVDLQIDLGNTCNSSCIMCNPTYSSRLNKEYNTLVQFDPTVFKSYPQFKNWADDPKLVDKFIEELITIDSIKYIHFLGGETLYLKSFYTICNALIKAGLAKDIILGTTTNGTIYSKELANIIKEFKQVHLGISIETTDSLNDYIRWPGQINTVLENTHTFLKLRESTGLQVSLRITPSVYSIYRIAGIFDFLIENKVIAESCNILTEPSCLRVELLPDNIKQDIIKQIKDIIAKHGIEPQTVAVNRRRNDLICQVISNIIYEYLTFLETCQAPADVEEQRYDLIKFTRAFERLHHNSILDHLPEYEEFLRSYGY
jgi:MoaA/NifB/PqqE/SkfB family radical SAM enzyme